MHRSTPKETIGGKSNADFIPLTPIRHEVSKRRLGMCFHSSKKIKQQKEPESKLPKSEPDADPRNNRNLTDSEQLQNGVDDLLLSEELFADFLNEPFDYDADAAKQSPNKSLGNSSQKSIDSPDIFLDNVLTSKGLDLGKDPFSGLTGLSQLFETSYNAESDAEPPHENSKETKETSHKQPVGFEEEPVGYSQFQENFETSFGVTPITQCVVLGPFYGLPSRVKDLIKAHKGITKLYDWQKECLKMGTAREKNNLIYALPTSGGKTLVAEILLLREMLCYQKTALFILPFVAIVQEKVRSLSPLAVDLGFLVEEYAAGKGTMPPRKRRRKKSILVCTIEKALAVVQSLIEENRLHEIGLAVIDELHLIGEGSGRGASLEMLLTFLMASRSKIQIVGMSATIGNLPDIAKFLNAGVFSGDFRPVELTEYVKCGSSISKVNTAEEELFAHYRDLPVANRGDPDGLGMLVQEVCPAESILIFCASKKNTENVAALLCKQLPKSMLEHKTEDKMKLMEMLGGENGGRVCPVLKESLRYGVAYHHSGLTADERKLLEEAYRNSIICCICCTSTLAAGVNLPAKRVILRAPYVGRDFIRLSKYKQMIGRAGRAGLGETGESILICQINELPKVTELLLSGMDEVKSTLTKDSCADLVTAAVGLKVANNRNSLKEFLAMTLLSTQAELFQINIKKLNDQIISHLLKSGTLKVVSGSGTLITYPKNESTAVDLEVTVPNNANVGKFRVTKDTVFVICNVARAAMKGGISLPIAQKLFTDLNTAKKNFNLQCDLHILHLITPYQVSDQVIPNKSTYFNIYMQLSDAEQQAAKAIGLSEYHMSRMAMGHTPKNVSMEVVNRFYVTLMLNELWKHRGVWEVASLFQVPRGQVQSLQSAASSFCWSVMRFCEDIPEFWAIRAMLSDFAPRLAYCCEQDLLPLMDLPAIKRARARQLYNAGYKTLQDIAKALPNELSGVITHLSTSTASHIIAAAKLKLYEKVENLKEEVEDAILDIPPL